MMFKRDVLCVLLKMRLCYFSYRLLMVWVEVNLLVVSALLKAVQTLCVWGLIVNFIIRRTYGGSVEAVAFYTR